MILMNDRRVRYAEDKCSFMEETWKKDYHEAQQSWELQDFLQDVIGLFDVMLALESLLQEQELDEDAKQDVLLIKRVEELFPKWLELATHVDEKAREIQRSGYEVEGQDKLKALIAEAKAFLNPSYELNAGLSKLRDLAIADDSNGLVTSDLLDQ